MWDNKELLKAYREGSDIYDVDDRLFELHPTRSDKYYMLSLLHKAIEKGDYLFDGVDTSEIGNSKTQQFIDKYGIDAVEDLLPKMLSLKNFSNTSKRDAAKKEYFNAYIFKDWDGSLSAAYDDRLYLKVYKWYTAVPIFDIHD